MLPSVRTDSGTYLDARYRLGHFEARAESRRLGGTGVELMIIA
jgi:hypothetical protein